MKLDIGILTCDFVDTQITTFTKVTIIRKHRNLWEINNLRCFINDKSRLCVFSCWFFIKHSNQIQSDLKVLNGFVLLVISKSNVIKFSFYNVSAILYKNQEERQHAGCKARSCKSWNGSNIGSQTRREAEAEVYDDYFIANLVRRHFRHSASLVSGEMGISVHRRSFLRKNTSLLFSLAFMHGVIRVFARSEVSGFSGLPVYPILINHLFPHDPLLLLSLLAFFLTFSIPLFLIYTTWKEEGLLFATFLEHSAQSTPLTHSTFLTSPGATVRIPSAFPRHPPALFLSFLLSAHLSPPPPFSFSLLLASFVDAVCLDVCDWSHSDVC